MPREEGHGDCAACDAKCCRYIVVEVPKPRRKIDVEEIRWFLAHENVQVFIDDDDGTWNLQFFTRCRHLTRNKRCTIYEHRYQICGDYDMETCEESDGEPDAVVFRNTEEFDAYWAKKKRARKKAGRSGPRKRPRSCRRSRGHP